MGDPELPTLAYLQNGQNAGGPLVRPVLHQSSSSDVRHTTSFTNRPITGVVVVLWGVLGVCQVKRRTASS